MATWDRLKADTFRQYGRYGAAALLKGFLTRRTFRPVVTMRLCQNARAGGAAGRLVLPLLKILHRCATHQAAMDFPWNAQFGAGLALTHGWGLVVSQGVRIGRNVTLFHGVTLGRRDRIDADGQRATGYPVLEDEVWIGPHAVIVGGVTIGRGSRIGAGAFVTSDVPPYSVVAGNPSVIVKRNCVPDVMHPAPAELDSTVEQPPCISVQTSL
ncbi:MAG: serine acetyltransferase [Burkholderiaceae bacterium]|nr:serine acetyltransferase [Burkholderiaceae bacterium]